MATKGELSEELNQKLNTDVEWEKLTKDDLENFKGMVESGELAEALLKHYAKNEGKEKMESVIDDWEPGKIAMRLI